MKNVLTGFFNKLDKWLHIRERLESGDIWKQVLVFYIIVVVLPVGVMLSVYYQTSVSATEREMVNTIYKAVEQAAQHIDLRLESMEEVSDNIFMSSLFNNSFSDTAAGSRPAQIEEQEELTENIEIFQRREDIQRIKLYYKLPKFYANEHVNFFSYQDLRGEPWLEELEQKNGAILWVGVREQSYSDGSEERVLTCARLMKDPGNISESTGALLIDVKYENIARILEETRVSDLERVFLFNGDGVCVSQDAQSRAEETQALFFDMEEGIRKQGSNYYMLKELANSGWKIGVEIPADAVTAEGSGSSRLLSVFFLVFGFLLFMLMFFIMFGYLLLRFSWRIKRIVRKLEQEGVEDIEKQKVEDGSEFYRLEHHIDNIIAHARALMRETYDARLEKQAAELKSLQAQINPHFLYNTLDNISWMAVRANVPEIYNIIQSLSQYFRLSLSGGRDIVSIDDELRLAEVYLEIQNSRFRGIITVEIEMEEKIKAYAIPKLTLQPLLENAVIHGLQRKEDKDWRIRIRGEEAESDIRLYIEDNGAGMSAEEAKALPERGKPGAGGHGYGVYNVNRRLRLYYGDGYGLQIRSMPDRGTSVCVSIAKTEYREET